MSELGRRKAEACEMRLFEAEHILNRRMSGNNHPDLKLTGEPYPVKVGRRVRGRAVGKVTALRKTRWLSIPPVACMLSSSFVPVQRFFVLSVRSVASVKAGNGG